MKLVKFKGGLGNQLFQYAFLKQLQNTTSDIVYADFSYYNRTKNDQIRKPRILKLNTSLNQADQQQIKQQLLLPKMGKPLSLLYKGILYLEKSFNAKYYFENSRKHTDINTLKDFSYFDGYWQSWKYTLGIEEELREELVPKYDIHEKTKKSLDKVSHGNSVFVGIRRGDYTSSNYAKKHYGKFEVDYYLKAMEIIEKRVSNPIYHIFSNDIDWVKSNMDFNRKVIFRETDDQTNDLEELLVLSSCKHAIIVNSTFYWWGAWLIKNPDKNIIAPKRWFADNKPIDIVPEDWIKL